MSKREEYNIKFYKITDALGNARNIFDIGDAVGAFKNLSFVQALYVEDVAFMITTIDKIQNSQSYSANFLKSSEVYDMYDVEFDNPNFIIHDLTIHMNDLKLLLGEWFAFLNS